MLIIYLLGIIAMAAADNKSPLMLFNEANFQFSAKMFTEVANANPGKSIVLSAFSVLPSLAQLDLASVGESHDEILEVIGLPNDNATKEVFPALNAQLRSAKGIELKTGNKIYIDENYDLNEEFSGILKAVFDSEIQKVNFSKRKETADDINAWVEQQTNHRIKKLASPDSFSQDTRAVLVNAIYFKGNWLNKFDSKFTTEKDFHVTKENTIKLPTMFKTGNFLYGESADLEAKLLMLPYEGQEASFVIVLPNEIDGITNLVQKLKDPSAVPKAIEHLHNAKVDVTMPKFKIETTINLKDVLTKMGITRLFDGGKAQLDNLLKNAGDLYVSEAVQKAVIEVNEEGAEAAAANEFVVMTRSFKNTVTIQFTVDHPFFYCLMVKNNILFSGIFVS